MNLDLQNMNPMKSDILLSGYLSYCHSTVQIFLQWFLSLTVTAKFLIELNVSYFEISFALFVLYQFIFTNIQGILHSETKFLAQLLHEWILLEFPMETLLLSAT